MKKLSDIVMELGKVQTAKDNPPFKTPQQIEKEGIANPINQKYDFKKPTMISMSKQDMETLHQDGTLEKDGITIVYEK
jgi:hypothetical protein